MKSQYYVELEAALTVAVYVEAESAEQAREIAAEWKPDDCGYHSVASYFARLSEDCDLVKLPEPADLEWELLSVTVEETTADAL